MNAILLFHSIIQRPRGPTRNQDYSANHSLETSSQVTVWGFIIGTRLWLDIDAMVFVKSTVYIYSL